MKVVDLYCDEPGCWNKKDWGTNYCMEHINSIYEEAMKRERAYEKAIPIHTGEKIPMMFIIMMIRMISPMTGLRNSMEEIMMADMMMRMITGRRTTGINNTRKLWR